MFAVHFVVNDLDARVGRKGIYELEVKIQGTREEAHKALDDVLNLMGVRQAQERPGIDVDEDGKKL